MQNFDNLNKNLLKSLVESEFSIVKNNRKLRSLNIIELNRDLKHFIRFLQNINENTSGFLHIFCESKSTTQTISNLLLLYKLSNRVTIQSSLPKYKQSVDSNVGVLFIDVSPKFLKKVMDTRLLSNNIFLITKMDLFFDYKTYGSYKIFNSFDDIKKILFLLIVISKIFTK
jgi:hypothetical protein